MSEKYYHGVRVLEEKEEVKSVISGTSALQVILGTAPVNQAKNPEAAVNAPVVCNTFGEAVEKLGYSENWKDYTLCQSMYAAFKLFGVSPVVFVNVLDPEKHKKKNDKVDVAVLNGQLTIEKAGIIRKSVVVQDGEKKLAEDVDYVLTYNDEGNLIITMISEEALKLTTVSVSSESIDPGAVKDEDIIGGYDAETGKESGLEVIRQVYPKTGMTAGLILAPGWSHNPVIGSVMIEKCKDINGAFSAECILDLDTETAEKYTDVAELKEKNGYEDSHAIVVWPKAVVNGKQIYLSAVYGAMTAYMDATNDNVPNVSPSNKLIGIEDAVIEGGTEVFMDRQQANALNGDGIVTLINESGWRAWGNNTSAYPKVMDQKDRWICSRRLFTWIANSLILIYHDRVDSPANFRLIESICDSENIRLNSYVAAGKLAGARIEYNEAENTINDILDGRLTFRIYVAAYTPAEDILFILKFDPQLLVEALEGAGR